MAVGWPEREVAQVFCALGLWQTRKRFCRKIGDFRYLLKCFSVCSPMEILLQETKFASRKSKNVSQRIQCFLKNWRFSIITQMFLSAHPWKHCCGSKLCFPENKKSFQENSECSRNNVSSFGHGLNMLNDHRHFKMEGINHQHNQVLSTFRPTKAI